MGKKISLIGQKFNKLLVIGDLGEGYWNCQCDCGQIKRIRGYELKSVRIKSCGRCGSRSNFIDLTGKQFGDWHVLRYAGDRKWECQCSCGKISQVNGAELRNGKSKSCGHATTGFKDLTDQKFGEWTALEYVGDRKWKCRCSCGKIQINDTSALLRGLTTRCLDCAAKARTIDITGKQFGEWKVLGKGTQKGYWKCQCSCGNIKEVEGFSLRSGTSLSCGHDNFIDLIGCHFGEWEVLRYAGNKKWECRCSCGTERTLSGGNLRNGMTLSCGCKQAKLRKDTLFKKYGDTAASRLFNPRTPESQDIFEDEEKFRSFLKDYADLTGEKPTSHDIALELGVSYHSVNRKLLQLGLKDYIQVGANHKSSYEKEIEGILEDLGVNYISNTRNVVPGIELDIYIPNSKIAIEINGDYWHSSQFKEYTFHQNKTIECSKHGIRLIHIFEYEWLDTIKKNKIINFIKELVTDKATKDIRYARKLSIKDVDVTECVNFLDRFHLQGSTHSNVRLGIYENDELLGVMTFGKPRFSNTFEWELIRLVFKPGMIIVGGAEKLFKHFVDKYKPSNIICYANIAKFTGNVYTRLGFKTSIHNITKPNYVWTIPGSTKVYTRYQTMVKHLIDSGLGKYGSTEDEIMDNLGYVKIYDSGNLKFEWRYEA